MDINDTIEALQIRLVLQGIMIDQLSLVLRTRMTLQEKASLQISSELLGAVVVSETGKGRECCDDLAGWIEKMSETL